MTIWVLFILYTSGPPMPAMWVHETKAKCEKAADNYKRYACVEVVVPK